MTGTKSKTILIVSDLQVPYHDKKAVQNLVQFTKDFKPDELVNVGDDIDSPETSRWNKGTAGEYSGTLQASFDATRAIHKSFRDALGDKPYHVSRSNHGDRTATYVRRYAPALDGLRCLDLGNLLGYDELAIQFHRKPFAIAPGWVCAHGDEGSLSKIAGRTAGLLAEKWGCSVVCGHTHRAGINQKSYGYNGKVSRTVTGLEAGHLMDVRKASYLDGGHADWQQSFAILYQHGNRVSPVLVPVHPGGRFSVEGKSYGD